MSEMVIDYLSNDDGYVPGRRSDDGQAASFEKPIQLLGNVSVVAWTAQPGHYVYPGFGPTGETFVVVEGEGTIQIEGRDPQELSPGAVVIIPPFAVLTFTVHTTIRKLAMVLDRAVQ